MSSTTAATSDASTAVDLRRAPLAELRAIDFRSPHRDFWADEAAIWDRTRASWAGLDDAAWRLPGAAPSDAGGPDWSLLDHVGHVVDWHEIATAYIGRAAETGTWPSDDDFDGGDFDTYNERRRERFASIPPAELRRRAETSRSSVLAAARAVPLGTIRSDAAWGWVHMVLHGHDIDHLVVIEPWADQLRARQIANDPFAGDPQPVGPDLDPALERFWADDAATSALFAELVGAVPQADWRTVADDAGWTIADHVGHLARWFEEGAAALEEHVPGRPWREMPPEGLDAFNARQVEAARSLAVDEVVARYEAGLVRLRRAARAMSEAEWRDPEGFSWAYEDLHGHLRAHAAMIGPACVRAGWPAATTEPGR